MFKKFTDETLWWTDYLFGTKREVFIRWEDFWDGPCPLH